MADLSFFPEKSVEKRWIHKYIAGEIFHEEDVVSGEEPLEIILKWKKMNLTKTISITMRTPGDDHLLALGFLFSEGIISSYDDVEAVSFPSDHKVKVYLSENVSHEMASLERNFYTTSSCGICGKSSIEAIEVKTSCDIVPSSSIKSNIILSLPEKLNQQQSLFELTGGIHACALFDLQGNLLELFEDVGRHNALDKLIGSAFKKKLLPLTEYILLLSGRVSFEMMQKATVAGIPTVVAIGAPSSLAVDLAQSRNHLLVGFLKNNRFNIYAGSIAD
jgi:FdhD protein